MIDAAGIETHVLPRTCYRATDGIGPRWRLVLVAINKTGQDLALRAVRITQAAGGARRQRTVAGDALKPMFVQGGAAVPRGKGVVLDIQEPAGQGITPRSVCVEPVFLTPRGAQVPCRRCVRLFPRRTWFLRFPLEGPWLAANARADLHCLGSQFGFDFVRAEDMAYHDHPPARRMALGEFASFAQVVRSPAAGVVLVAESDFPDLPPTPTKATFADGPPQGAPRTVMCGNHVVIRLDSGECVFLGHLQRGSVRVAAGRRVKEGQILGKVGNSGNTSGPHLHIEVLDAPPDLDSVLSLQFAQSGVPFGFSPLRLHGRRARKKSPGRIVPSKGDIVSPR